jgi:hypothetical protein
VAEAISRRWVTAIGETLNQNLDHRAHRGTQGKPFQV